MSARPNYTGKPTLPQVMRRPQWILALLLALAVGGGFALLAQWQMGSAIQLQQTETKSEEVRPLLTLTSAGKPVNEVSAGQMVSLQAQLVTGDMFIVKNRMNQGEQGYWVVGHFVTEEDSHLAIALGWALTESDAQQAAQKLDNDQNLINVHEIQGRYMPPEGIELSDPGESERVLPTLATGQLINLWQPFDSLSFSGYLVSADEATGLDVIDSVPPLPEETINWLNLFYAIEWLVFAGFAVFFWYRLARDAWEKEHELLQLEKKPKSSATHAT